MDVLISIIIVLTLFTTLSYGEYHYDYEDTTQDDEYQVGIDGFRRDDNGLISPPSAIQWVGRGYNVLFGDPDRIGFGNNQNSAVDPGRTLTNILKFTKNTDHKDRSNK